MACHGQGGPPAALQHNVGDFTIQRIALLVKLPDFHQGILDLEERGMIETLEGGSVVLKQRLSVE